MKALLAAVLFLVAMPAAAQTIAITNARVMDADRDERGMTIIVRDGRIATVSRGAPVPEGASIIDAAGQPVTPALAAAATQIGLVGMGGAPNTQDASVSGGSSGAALDASLAIDGNALTIEEARAGGVAWAMIYLTANDAVFAGTGAILRLAPDTPAVSAARAAMIARPSAQSGNGSRAAAWTSLRNALQEAAAPATTSNTPRDDMLGPADLAALRPVVRGAMPLALLVDREADIRQAIAVGRDFGIRVVIVGGAEAWRVADELAASNVGVVLDPLDDLPFTYQTLGARRDNAAILSRAGVPIAFMVSGQTIYLSYNVGTALREGAGLAAANGLPRGEALRAITSGPAQVWTGTAGQGLAVGAPGDLVVWDGDPLEPASAPRHVVIAGTDVSRVTRQTLLRDRYHPSHNEAPLPPAYRE